MCKGFVAGRSLYCRRLQRPKILSTDVKNEHGGKIVFEKSLGSVQVGLHRPLFQSLPQVKQKTICMFIMFNVINSVSRRSRNSKKRKKKKLVGKQNLRIHTALSGGLGGFTWLDMRTYYKPKVIERV